MKLETTEYQSVACAIGAPRYTTVICPTVIDQWQTLSKDASICS